MSGLADEVNVYLLIFAYSVLVIMMNQVYLASLG